MRMGLRSVTRRMKKLKKEEIENEETPTQIARRRRKSVLKWHRRSNPKRERVVQIGK